MRVPIGRSASQAYHRAGSQACDDIRRRQAGGDDSERDPLPSDASTFPAPLIQAKLGGRDVVPVNLCFPDPNPGDILGGWHDRTYGHWNGNQSSDPGVLTPSMDEHGKPRWQGVDDLREPLWTAAGFVLRLAVGSVKPSRRGGSITAKCPTAARYYGNCIKTHRACHPLWRHPAQLTTLLERGGRALQATAAPGWMNNCLLSSVAPSSMRVRALLNKLLGSVSTDFQTTGG